MTARLEKDKGSLDIHETKNIIDYIYMYYTGIYNGYAHGEAKCLRYTVGLPEMLLVQSCACFFTLPIRNRFHILHKRRGLSIPHKGVKASTSFKLPVTTRNKPLPPKIQAEIGSTGSSVE